MIQAMQILQLTTPELLARIEDELLENPFLEVNSDASPDSEATAPSESESESDPPDDIDLAGEFDDVGPLFERAARGEGQPLGDREQAYDAMQNLAARERPLVEELLAEMRVEEGEEEEVLIAEAILASLDDRGYLPNGLEPVAEETGVPIPVLEEVLSHLRQLGPDALGARDLRECYLLQLAALPEQHPLAEAVLDHHFEDLLANRMPQISKSLGVEVEDVRAAIEILRGFDPRPAEAFAEDETTPLLPDVIVEPTADGYEVSLVRDVIPELRLTDGAREALDNAREDPRLFDFLTKKIETARWFLDAVGQRRDTLLRIARELVRRQREFLDYGPDRVAPLKMQEIADTIGVHISTVSRALRGKNAQTPQGILPMKSFFSGGQRTVGGGSRSRVSIQERIKRIIDAEDKQSPLSDEEVVRILAQRDGIKMARRTVTKYRKALAIPASTLRREY